MICLGRWCISGERPEACCVVVEIHLLVSIQLIVQQRNGHNFAAALNISDFAIDISTHLLKMLRQLFSTFSLDFVVRSLPGEQMILQQLFNC